MNSPTSNEQLGYACHCGVLVMPGQSHEHPPSNTSAVEYALRQGDRCRNYGPERVENEDVIVILADEVERLRERCNPSKTVIIGDTGHYVSEAVFAEITRLQRDVARYESGRVVLTGEIDRLRMAQRLNVETVARLQQERDERAEWAAAWHRALETVATILEVNPCGSDKMLVQDIADAIAKLRAALPPSDAQWQSCVDNPPKEWTVVLAYRPGPNTTYFLAERFLHSSGKYLWTMSGVTGHGVEPPSHWMPLPGAPVTKEAGPPEPSNINSVGEMLRYFGASEDVRTCGACRHMDCVCPRASAETNGDL